MEEKSFYYLWLFEQIFTHFDPILCVKAFR